MLRTPASVRPGNRGRVVIFGARKSIFGDPRATLWPPGLSRVRFVKLSHFWGSAVGSPPGRPEIVPRKERFPFKVTRIRRPRIFGFPGPGSRHTKTQGKSRVFASRRYFWRPFRKNRLFRAQDRERVVDYCVSGRQRLRGSSFLGSGRSETARLSSFSGLRRRRIAKGLSFWTSRLSTLCNSLTVTLAACSQLVRLSANQGFDFRMLRLTRSFLMSSRAPVSRMRL